jgi:hypothetical protein
MSESINFRESKVKSMSSRACAIAALAFVCGSAVAQDITVGEQPDLVIGKALPKAELPVRVAVAAVVAPAPIAEPAVPAIPARSWTVEVRDVTLSNTFQRWAAAAGWRVRWDAAKNVMVEAPDTVTGSFEDAVEAQLASPGIAYGSYPLEVCFYPNTPPLARVTRKGEQDKECK